MTSLGKHDSKGLAGPSLRQQALAHWDLINRLASRRFPDSPLAEEAALYVMDRLAADDWQRLRAFAGRASLATYIASLTFRLLEDFARSRYGRRKAPVWIRRLGGIWTLLFRLLCLERYPAAEAVALVCQRLPVAEERVDRAAYAILGEVVDCGGFQGEILSREGEQERVPDPGNNGPPDQMEQRQGQEMFAALARVLFGDVAAEVDGRLLARLATCGQDLSGEERLLLKLCFRDGVNVAEAGRMLGLSRHQTHGRLRRLLARLRQHLDQAGLGAELRLFL